jgi:hypothetical protein
MPPRDLQAQEAKKLNPENLVIVLTGFGDITSIKEK